MKIAKTAERWKEIEGFPNYMVSSHGRVWSKNRKRCLKPKVTKKGYYFFELCSKGVGYPIRLNRLVAQAFLENPENLPVVNHKDGDKTNNNVSNLEWVSYQENTQHAYRVGLMKRALDETQIEELKELYATGGWTQEKLAQKYKISKSTTSKYVRNVESLKHKKRSGGLPIETKNEIVQLYLTGEYTQKELAVKYGIARSSVSNYVRAVKINDDVH